MAPRRATQADVARQAGVSRATVSLVLNPSAQRMRVPISSETRLRVLEAVRELGYTPNPVAQMLARGANNLIGVFTYEPVFPHEREDFYYPFLTGIERGAQQLGYDVLLITRRRSPGQRTIYADGSNSLRLADGAILLGAQPDRLELCTLSEEQYPFVFIGRREVPNCEIDWCNSDYASGSRQATQYLLDLGHRALAFVGYRQNQESFQDRLEGCRSAAEAAGVQLVVVSSDSTTSEDGDILQLIERHHPTALLCADENTFAAIAAVFEQTGIRVPEDMSIVCLGAVDHQSNAAYDPTYVRLDRPAVGEAALRLLVARLHKEAPPQPQHILIPCELVIGKTTSRPADPPYPLNNLRAREVVRAGQSSMGSTVCTTT